MRYYGSVNDDKDLITKEYADKNYAAKMILQTAWPVGSIYWSTSTVTPAAQIEGTWRQLDCKLLVSGDSTDTDLVAWIRTA